MASNPLDILLLEDTDTDAELVERALVRAELPFALRRVDNENDFVRELHANLPDLVLADYRLPSFDGLAALRIVREMSADLPFLIVSGTLGDERAVEVLKLGATDYILKDRLSRLAPAILRARQENANHLARQRAEALVEQSRRIESVGRLATTMSHEFNNVLMTIEVAATQLARGGAPVVVGQLAKRIGDAVKRGQRITSDVARFTRPAQLNLQPLDVNAWAQSFSAELRSLLGLAVTLEVQTSSEALNVRADQQQLEQVLTNLAVNARDAMSRGGRATLTIEEVVLGDRTYAEIVFADTGAGIEPDVLQHIFEPLFTTKRAGTGLGLAVSYQVIASHGGEMYAESTPGAGTAFHILLPQHA
ncbi:MAG TPA: ATP-binding protein [Thermoanaerobaculia bacterium]|nr:ATP-binding protein [Thermoanaerobaculia bacterium]